MTVVTTVSPRSRPLLFRCLARMAMTKSPSTRGRGIDGQHAVAVAVEGQAQVEAVGAHERLQRLDMGRAALVVDVEPVGSVCSSTTSAPDSLKASGAASNMAPLAQSTAMRSPDRSSGMRLTTPQT